MKNLTKVISLSGLLVVLTACSPFSNADLEKEILKYNEEVIEMSEEYTKFGNKTEKADQVVQFALSDKRGTVIDNSVVLDRLSEEYVQDYKTYATVRNNVYTSLGSEKLTQVITLVGYTTKMHIEVMWYKGQVIAVERTIVGEVH